MGAVQGCAKCSSCENEREPPRQKLDPANFRHIQKLVRSGEPLDGSSVTLRSAGSLDQELPDPPAGEVPPNRPLCFSAQCYQLTHPQQLKVCRHGQVHKDADATLASPMLLAVADGLSQLEAFGIDATELPNELLRVCEELATESLVPEKLQEQKDSDGVEWRVNTQTDGVWCKQERMKYHGPVKLLKDAFESTESLGSTTVLLGIMDNSTVIHGKLHPMMAVLTIGDSELLLLRRVGGWQNQLQKVFHTEHKNVAGRDADVLELSRVDERVDPEYDEDAALRLIERGSKTQCVTCYEGDVVVMGTDGVFDNLFVEEIMQICNMFLPPQQSGRYKPLESIILSALAQQIVQTAHTKTQAQPGGALPPTPIGPGGKIDDTAVVVAEVVEWTEAHHDIWDKARRKKECDQIISCFPDRKAKDAGC